MIEYPSRMHKATKKHPICCFFEAFPSTADPDCNFYGEFLCHMSELGEHAHECNGDYLKCPLTGDVQRNLDEIIRISKEAKRQQEKL